MFKLKNNEFLFMKFMGKFNFLYINQLFKATKHTFKKYEYQIKYIGSYISNAPSVLEAVKIMRNGCLLIKKKFIINKVWYDVLCTKLQWKSDTSRMDLKLYLPSFQSCFVAPIQMYIYKTRRFSFCSHLFAEDASFVHATVT